MKTNIAKIKVDNNSMKFLNYLVYNKIEYYNLIKKNNCYILDVNNKYIKLISKRYNVEIIKFYGITGIFNYIKYNKFIMIGVFLGILMLLLLTNTIFEVNINIDDENIKEIIDKSLNKYEIVKYKSKKKYDEIEKIKKEILNENKDNLEWIEIVEDGCKYNVEVTKRVKGYESYNVSNNQDIVALKDGLILYINTINGTKIRDVNDYVKKGEIVISGNITKNDKVVKQVKADGIVYAEVWYTASVTMPYKYTEYLDTSKYVNHYYIDFFGLEMSLIGKYNSDKTINEKKLILDKPYLFFKIYKEKKKIYEYNTINLTREEAYEQGILKAENIIKRNLGDGEYIIDKKVLKKQTFSSKMELEIFFKVYENITDIKELEEVLNDK